MSSTKKTYNSGTTNITQWTNSDDVLHRLDGPALIYSNGYKAWYINGERHRTDGPAVIFPDGSEFWYYNNKKHRIDGPAVELFNGKIEWWYNNEQYYDPQRIPFNLIYAIS